MSIFNMHQRAKKKEIKKTINSLSDRNHHSPPQKCTHYVSLLYYSEYIFIQNIRTSVFSCISLLVNEETLL